MSIEIPTLIESNDYKTSQSVIAGHLKNDAFGNFSFGESGSSWTFLQTLTTSSGSSITFSSLDGDTDLAYRIVWDIFNTVALSDHRFFLRPNGDTINAQSLAVATSSGATPTRIHDTTRLVASRFTVIPPIGTGSISYVPFSRSGMLDFYAARPQAPGEAVMGRDMISFETMAFPVVIFTPLVGVKTVTLRDSGTKSFGRWFGSTGVNVTSLTIASLVSGGLGTGSWSLYKIKSS